jgi:5-methylcytosine-specific restriction endonuclease McrA
MKRCTRCEKKRDESEFYLDRGKPRGICKPCIRSARSKHYQEHREESIAASLQYGKTRRGAAKRKAWLAARAKTDKQIEYTREWAKTPKGQQARRGRVNKFAKTPKGNAANKRRHARRRSVLANVVATLTAEQWSTILADHNFRCAYCKKPFSKELPATQDHVTPLSKCGHHTADNVVPACKPCNSRKKDRVL